MANTEKEDGIIEDEDEENENIIVTGSTDLPIELNAAKAVTYYSTPVYDKKLLNTPYTWHQIIVHHKGKKRKAHILKSLFAAVNDAEFVPIAYRTNDTFSSFLVRQCHEAIEALFSKSLKITLTKNICLGLTVKFNIAEYKIGQISPFRKIEGMLKKKLQELENVDNVQNVLVLKDFAKEFDNIILNLGNKAVFKMLCKILYQSEELLNNVQGIIFSYNHITSLEPLVLLKDVNFDLLDLSHNKIKNISEINQLAGLQIKKLYLINNPCTTKSSWVQDAKKILPNIILDEPDLTNETDIQAYDEFSVKLEGNSITSVDDKSWIKLKMSKNYYKWHQILINHRGQFTKEEILINLFSLLENQSTNFFPCYYKRGTKEDFFFVFDAYEQLEILMKNDLKLVINKTDKPIRIKMILNVKNYSTDHIKPLEAIKLVLAERYNILERRLNLKDINTSEQLKTVYVSLQTTKTLSTIILQACQQFMNNVTELKLANNNITSCKGMKSLNLMKNLKILDISNNLIASMADLEGLPKQYIKELNIDGNPLCESFTCANEYVKIVKDLFPNITRLDGESVTGDSVGVIQKNFLISLESYGLIEKFVNLFFTQYDLKNRAELANMYSENGLFSISLNYDPVKVNDYVKSKFEAYDKKSRNLINSTTFLRALATTYMGLENIAKTFQILPETEHDMFSFSIESPIYTPEFICIIVNGVFREIAKDVLDVDTCFSFRRTFYLKKTASELGCFKCTMNYEITNDLWLITNPTSSQIKKSFMFAKPDIDDEPINVEDKEALQIMFQSITNLRPLWCSRYLENEEWDFEKSLNKFKTLFENDKIPDVAFIK